jgi:hypothetical protein
MAKRYGLSSLLLVLCLVLCASPAWAQWMKDGVLVCNESDYQYGQRMIPDGAFGAVIVWQDYRNGVDADLYGAKVDQNGYVGGFGGVPVCVMNGYQQNPVLIPDGTGGGIVAWTDDRMGGANDIYAQRVDGTGAARWTENGIPICAQLNHQDGVRIVPDGADGAIIVWGDMRGGGGGAWDIYAQRVNGDGDTLWAADGVPVDTSLYDQAQPEVVSDGSGGAIIMWFDARNGNSDIYAQRIDGNGDILWGEGGIPVCVAGNYRQDLCLEASSSGGACAGWTDYRNGWGEIYVQKIDLDGNALWQYDGLPVCQNSAYQYGPQLADDGDGGFIVSWDDERNYDEIYAQRIDSDGNLAWAQYGVLVFPSYGDCRSKLMSDGSGGAIAALDMYLEDDGVYDIYAQRLDHDGNMLWGQNGLGVCRESHNQFCPTLASDGRGGAIFAWTDYREESGYSDIYAQRVGPSGLWGSPEPKIVSCLDVPEDQGGWVRIKTRASSHDVSSEYDSPIAGYNVWRMIPGGGGPKAAASSRAAVDRSKTLALLRDPATANGVRVGGSDAIALGLPEGDWESVGFWLATRDTIYNCTVPTKNDSTEAGTAEETYIVTAHSSKPGIFVASEPAMGYSVDNIAPGVTPGFAGNETASPSGLRLSWTPNAASDLWKYNIHRGDDGLFVPDETNLLGSTTATQLQDESWVKAYLYFYKLVAVDRHGNTGPAALLTPDDIKVGTMLQSFAASLKQSVIEVSWTLSEVDEAATFRVLRSVLGNEFAELSSAAIARDGLAFSIVDRGVEPGTTYKYRVDLVSASGARALFETEAISTPAMPLTLHQNHPNPFNPSTTISYYLPDASVVTLEIYDSTGRLVTRLADREQQEKGTHSVGWRGLDTAGRSVSSGMYFYRLTSGKETISKKMVLLR